MCIEIFSPFVPLEIPFECEEVEFTGPESFVASYTALVRNAASSETLDPAGDTINSLHVLYPRQLLEVNEKKEVDLQVFDNIKEGNALRQLQGLRKKANLSDVGGEQILTMTIPDPRRSHEDLEGIRGRFTPIKKFNIPTKFTQRTLTLLEKHHGGLGAFIAELDAPLGPGESQWVSWRTEITNAGRSLGENCLGKQIAHSFACPSRVRATFEDVFLNAIRKAEEQRGNPDYKDSAEKDLIRYNDFVDEFALRKSRQVKTGYYELNIKMGNPSQMSLLDWYVCDSPVLVDSCGADFYAAVAA